MGHFKVEVVAVGGHGCQREVKSGETITKRCEYEGCPDCLTREYLEKLKKSSSVEFARLTHWPSELPTGFESKYKVQYPKDGEAIDNLLTGVREKGFS